MRTIMVFFDWSSSVVREQIRALSTLVLCQRSTLCQRLINNTPSNSQLTVSAVELDVTGIWKVLSVVSCNDTNHDID